VETTLAALCELLVELRTPEETVIGAASGARK
jgi:hypothetical protein